MKQSPMTDLVQRERYGYRSDFSPRGDQDEIQSEPSAIVEAIRQKGALATSCVLGRCGLTMVVQIVVPDALSAGKLAAYLGHHGLATAPCPYQSHTQGSWVVKVDAADAQRAGLWRPGDDIPHRKPAPGVFDPDHHVPQWSANSPTAIEAIRRSGAVITNLRANGILVIQIAASDATSARRLAAYLKDHTRISNPQVRQSCTTGSWVVQIDAADAQAVGLLRSGDHFPHRPRVAPGSRL